MRQMFTQNVCKFVLPKDEAGLVGVNYVYECQNSHIGEKCVNPNHQLCLVEEGTGILRCDGQSSLLSPGCIFLCFASIPYQIDGAENLKYYYITFRGTRSEELFQRFDVSPSNTVFEGHNGLIPLWQNNLSRANSDNIDLLIESLILYTFSELKIVRSKQQNAISVTLSYLDAHFTETSLTLARTAEELRYNAKYLSNLFTKTYGISFTEYLRLLRIKHAILLLENGITSIKNVAHLSGFSDPLYFSKVFKKETGVSPLVYSKQRG